MDLAILTGHGPRFAGSSGPAALMLGYGGLSKSA